MVQIWLEKDEDTWVEPYRSTTADLLTDLAKATEIERLNKRLVELMADGTNHEILPS